jgi:hypothetical protein
MGATIRKVNRVRPGRREAAGQRSPVHLGRGGARQGSVGFKAPRRAQRNVLQSELRWDGPVAKRLWAGMRSLATRTRDRGRGPHHEPSAGWHACARILDALIAAAFPDRGEEGLAALVHCDDQYVRAIGLPDQGRARAGPQGGAADRAGGPRPRADRPRLPRAARAARRRGQSPSTASASPSSRTSTPGAWRS